MHILGGVATLACLSVGGLKCRCSAVVDVGRVANAGGEGRGRDSSGGLGRARCGMGIVDAVEGVCHHWEVSEVYIKIGKEGPY